MRQLDPGLPGRRKLCRECLGDSVRAFNLEVCLNDYPGLGFLHFSVVYPGAYFVDFLIWPELFESVAFVAQRSEVSKISRLHPHLHPRGVRRDDGARFTGIFQ